MKVKKMEELLLQEMEDVKGGIAGIVNGCSCTSGAGQGPDGTGPCLCSKGGAAQKTFTEIPKEPIEPGCLCETGAGQITSN